MSYKILLRFDKLIKIGIFSSASNLKVVIKGLSTNKRCNIKHCDRDCPVAAVACFARYVTKSLINMFNLNKVILPLIF